MFIETITMSIVLLTLALLCEHAERKSRRWYQDRMMLRVAGICYGLAGAAFAWALSFVL